MRFLSRLAPWAVIAAAFAAVVYIPDIGPERYTDLAALFRHERSRQASAGYAVAVSRDGAVIYQEAFGIDGSGQNLAADTPFYLGPASRILAGAVHLSLDTTPADGISFDELLQDRVTIPLGMHGTTADPDTLRSAAMGSGQFFGVAFPYESKEPAIGDPAEGIVSTIADMGKFISYLTARSGKSIPTLPKASLSRLFLPPGADGSNDYGWRISSDFGTSIAFQGGSLPGFSSRIVVWPERNTAIAILSAQGGAVQSDIVLPLLTQAAGKILFEASSPRLFPLQRALAFVGFLFLVYATSLFLQTAGSYRWSKALQERNELGRGKLTRRLVILRTTLGLGARGALLALAPLAAGLLLHASLTYRQLLVMEPGGTAFFIIVLTAGCLRNFARLLWLRHLSRG